MCRLSLTDQKAEFLLDTEEVERQRTCSRFFSDFCGIAPEAGSLDEEKEDVETRMARLQESTVSRLSLNSAAIVLLVLLAALYYYYR